MLPLCLVVSADAAYASALQGSLRSHGFKLYSVGDLAATRPALGQWRFDAILCDADGSAAESVNATVRWPRREQPAPIVVLASPGCATAPVAALEAGATELIDKESSPHVCRIRRKLREAGATALALETIHGQGYALRLRSDNARAEAYKLAG
jgi:DNA-binding response OmpR family regulator